MTHVPDIIIALTRASECTCVVSNIVIISSDLTMITRRTYIYSRVFLKWAMVIRDDLMDSTRIQQSPYREPYYLT